MTLNLLIWVPAGLAVAIILFSWSRSKAGLGDKLGPPGWSFGNSWASSLTAALVLFQTFFGQNLLPASGTFMSGTMYGSLAAMFGGGLVAAPLIYLATGSYVKTGEDVQTQGRVWGFLIAAAMVLWAVIGQLAETLMLALDLTRGNLPWIIARVFVVVAVLVLVAGGCHGARSTYYVLNELHSQKLTEAFNKARAPRWVLP
jgi:hypothetical protein